MVNAVRRDLIEARRVFITPYLEGERAIPHSADAHKPRGFKGVGVAPKRIAADIDSSLWQVAVSHDFSYYFWAE
jgi:hypothetical protein